MVFNNWSYMVQDQYLIHIEKLFDQHEDGTAVFWEDSGTLSKNMTPLCPHCQMVP